MSTRVLPAVAVVFATVLAACGDPDGGAPTVRISGGDTAVHGIPTDAFSDGWNVHLDLVLVTVGAVELLPADDGAPLSSPGFQIFDLHKGGDLVLADFPDADGRYRELRYVVRPDPDAVAANAGSDAIALRASGDSVRIKGTAARGDTLVWFDWSFPKDVTHARCDLDGSGEVTVSVHPELLFVDDLVASDTRLAFDLIASADGADASDLDGTVTLAELAATPLAGQTRYQVGGLPITDLRGFIAHQAGTLGRFDGDRRCLAVVDAVP